MLHTTAFLFGLIALAHLLLQNEIAERHQVDTAFRHKTKELVRKWERDLADLQQQGNVVKVLDALVKTIT